MLRHKKIISSASAMLLSALIAVEAIAAPPAATYDETLYINLDSYGSATKSSVVKSYSLNSNTDITDYGTYGDIINMTDYTEAQTGENSVKFDFSKSASIPKRFYFEGKDPVLTSELPWNIDVSYKLNGVPAKAEELAGTSGLIEINIDAVPNENSSDYYKNNLLMEAACVVDVDDVLSVDAPGSQIVSVGSLKTIVFFALPGEEQHFTLSIGSDDFEFSGMIFMLQPATMSQVDKINDLRDAKEDIEDSADTISDSLDIILDTLDGMQKSFSDTSAGLKELDKARGIIADSKNEVYDEAEKALNDIQGLSDALEPYSAHFDTAQSAVNDINTDLNSLNDSVQAFTSTLTDIKSNMDSINAGLAAIDDLITSADEDETRWHNVLESMSDNIKKLSKNSENIRAYLKGISDAGENLGNSLETLSSDGNVGYISDSLMQSFYENGDVNSGGIWAVLYSIQYLSSDISALSKNVGNLCGILGDYDKFTKEGFNIEQLTDDLSELSDLSQKAIDNIYSHSDDFHSIIADSQDLTDIIGDASLKAQSGIDAINSSVETANKYKSDIDSLISDSKNTVEKTNSSLKSVHSFLTKLRDMLKNSGESLNTGTEAALNGIIDALSQSITGLSQTGVIKNAKDTIKNLADDKWDEYTGDDNNLLNMDSSLPAQSFTSDKNSAPQSIQVIMRTDEITKDDDDAAPDINEDTGIVGTVFTRLIGIFKKLFGMIGGLFK